MTSTREALESVAALLAGVIDQLPADPPEVPERVEVWPEDDRHLRDDIWLADHPFFWIFEPTVLCPIRWVKRNKHAGEYIASNFKPYGGPFYRTTDNPIEPPRFDSIADIPEDVDRAKGKYKESPCELARSPLSSTGWMIRIDHNYVLPRWVEYMSADKVTLTDIEEVIDHE